MGENGSGGELWFADKLKGGYVTSKGGWGLPIKSNCYKNYTKARRATSLNDSVYFYGYIAML